MKSRINLHKNFIFLGVIFLGVVYSVLLLTLIYKFAQNCALEWQILLLQWSNPLDQNNLDATIRFFAGAIGILLMAYSLFSVSKIILGIFKTNKIKNDFQIINKRGLNIIQENRGDVFTAGFFNPKIFISKDLLNNLSKQELDIVLMHEKEHISNRDNLMLIIFKFALSILPPIPGKNDVLEYFNFLIEINADIPAIEKYGESAFFQTVEKVISNKFSTNLFTGFANDYRRINYHMNKVRWFSLKTIVMMVVYFVTGFFAISLVGTVRASNRCQQVTDCVVVSKGDMIHSCEIDNIVKQSKINQSNIFNQK